MKKGLLLIVIMTLGSVLLSGCLSERDRLIKEGYPQAYAQGYEDGCKSGQAAAGDMFSHFKKDIQLFNSDKDYHEGWQDGFQQCKSKQEAIHKQNQEGLEEQRLLEEKRHDKKMEKHWKSEDMFKGVDTQKLERDLKKKYNP